MSNKLGLLLLLEQSDLPMHCLLRPMTKDAVGFNPPLLLWAGPRSAVDRAPDSQVRGPGFDTRSGHIFSFLLPLIHEGQLSVTDKSMCLKYWLTA